MPRNIKDPGLFRSARRSPLAVELAEELRSDREFGQPRIDEEHFKTGAIRISAIWDRWDRVDSVDRTATIIQAYRIAEGDPFADRIALAGGLTIPEAHASGLLPFQLIAALRTGDPLTSEQCRQAMIDQGASLLLDPDQPQLRFATRDEAESCRHRLGLQFPGSEPVWQIHLEAGGNLETTWDALG